MRQKGTSKGRKLQENVFNYISKKVEKGQNFMSFEKLIFGKKLPKNPQKILGYRSRRVESKK